MKSSKDYSKFKNEVFTEIRKWQDNYNNIGDVKILHTPTQNIKAKIIKKERIKKADITEELAQADFDDSRDALIKQLEIWYGKKFDDFALLTMKRLAEKEEMSLPIQGTANQKSLSNEINDSSETNDFIIHRKVIWTEPMYKSDDKGILVDSDRWIGFWYL
jgi:hypothetical protein